MQHSRLTWISSICLLLCIQWSSAQSVLINEFMSDNESSIVDDDGEYSDWIELYNPGSSVVNLHGYHLTDDKDDLQKWTFPNIEIGAKEFLTIYASGKDRQNDAYLHTNFKISSSGEKLILSNSLEIEIDEFDKVELEEDETFGRLPDGSMNKVILPSPSPGASNNSVNKLTFSHDAGFYDSSIQLNITSLLGDSIFYTVDGSEPTPESLVYTLRITLKNKTNSPNVWSEIPTTPPQELINKPAWQSPGYLIDKANTIRCASFKNREKTSKTYTKTYLIDSVIFEKYDLPVISLITEGSNFFDYDNGIYVPGATYNADDPAWTGNYFIDERESERPVHIEYFENDGTLGLSQDAGVRIHGGKTRHVSQKSLKLYARDEYGNKFFRYPLMPENGVEKYERFLLQTTMAAWGGGTVIKDILAHEVARDLNFEKMDYQPAVVFLNGEYWGIHHIRDRIDEEYLSYTTGLDKDSLQIYRWDSGHYGNLVNYFKDNIPLDDADYNYISTQMDIDGFIDYNIAEMFLRNYDWPANNTRLWKPKSPDGKWRWIFFDIDGGFFDYNYNMLEHNTNADSTISWPNNPKSTFFFRSLIENDMVLEKFLERYKDLIENDFRPSITLSKLDYLIDQYQFEMPQHIKRWNFPESYNSWLEDINIDLLEFLKERPCAVVENMIEFFDLQDYEVECEGPLNVTILPNDHLQIVVAPNPNTGQFSLINRNSTSRVVNIHLINSLGERIHQIDNLELVASQSHSIQFTNITSGIYILQIQYIDFLSNIPIVITE